MNKTEAIAVLVKVAKGGHVTRQVLAEALAVHEKPVKKDIDPSDARRRDEKAQAEADALADIEKDAIAVFEPEVTDE